MISPAGIVDIQAMRFDPQAGLTRLLRRSNNRRTGGRLEQEAVICDLGQVLDLSVTGMRVQCRRTPKEKFSTHLCGLGVQMTVHGRVVWSKKIGLLKHEIGVESISLSAEATTQLTPMAMNNRFRRAA